MFVSHEKNAGKKTFQKPNILRRKLKTQFPQANLNSADVFPSTKLLHVNTKNVDKSNFSNPHIKQTIVHERGQILASQFILSPDNTYLRNSNESLKTAIDANINNSATTASNITENNKSKKKHECNSLNIDSFINVTTSEENLPVPDTIISSEKKIGDAKMKSIYELPTNSVDNMVDNYNVTRLESDGKPDLIKKLSPSIPIQNTLKQPLEVICASTPTRAVSVELFSNRAVKFKCDEPNCNKGFWSEEKLRKHKNSHNKQSSVRTQGQITLIECPVKKVQGDGVEEKCPRTFQVRRDLLKHLNADHSPEDALHKCEVCGRRFFWALGLRAHAQSVCARGGLACAWPGCSRVFRLPCRLREHARAHTGDRPYLCHYPDCGWAFRSASKLVRHARRHTGERRHACGACGRAFLRAEHLRDHARTHHPRAHRCVHPGCEQSFTNTSTLYMHMKKVHKKVENEQVSSTYEASNTEGTGENIYLEEEPAGGVLEWRAARTHCTWPLPPRAAPPDLALVLGEDVQVENTEGSANNVYTVRSDLFLHGNVLIDDDSQNMVGGETVASVENEAPLDNDLCLTDAHPTIDLMQEELMYQDTVVDESSFRVFLMNGEELT